MKKRHAELFRKISALSIFALCLGPATPAFPQSSLRNYFYAAVISKTAYADAGWKAVADSLVARHGRKGTAKLFTWASSVDDVRTDLSSFRPDYIGFIARPVDECNSRFIATVSRLSRTLDADPYGDAVWGIITGYEAADALRAISESLTVKTMLSASGNLSYEPPLQRFYQGVGMTCDSYTKTDYLFPGTSGNIYTEEKRPEGERDRIKLVAKWLNAESITLEVAGKGAITGPVDCIMTGGHGNVNLWQCHYPDAGSEGYMRSSGGKLYGAPASGGSIAINAPTPKILWCASNCLMGNPDNSNNIVYAAFHTGHAVQMFGFVNSASSGDEFMAWGVYDRVTKSAGTYTLAEGFFLSNNNALFEQKYFTKQVSGPIGSYMDSTVFYGDPAGAVVFHDVGDTARAYKTELSWAENNSGSADFSFTFTMVAHDLEFGAGYCYQFRPISRLPVRIDPGSIAVTKNEGHTADITDNLLIWEMLSSGETLRKGASKTLQWSATVTDDRTGTAHGNAGKRPGRSSAPQLTMAFGAEGLAARLTNLSSGAAAIRIVDQAGRERYAQRFADGSSKRYVRLPVRLAPGVYAAVLVQEGVGSTIQFAVLR
ncbi:MAG: hypothetical protein JXA18_02385 [Chitinispirillaceae bacterium]|nr:hypothetical protein [Chitinispirillaceae bacterium]